MVTRLYLVLHYYPRALVRFVAFVPGHGVVPAPQATHTYRHCRRYGPGGHSRTRSAHHRRYIALTHVRVYLFVHLPTPGCPVVACHHRAWFVDGPPPHLPTITRPRVPVTVGGVYFPLHTLDSLYYTQPRCLVYTMTLCALWPWIYHIHHVCSIADFGAIPLHTVPLAPT